MAHCRTLSPVSSPLNFRLLRPIRSQSSPVACIVAKLEFREFPSHDDTRASVIDYTDDRPRPFVEVYRIIDPEHRSAHLTTERVATRRAGDPVQHLSADQQCLSKSTTGSRLSRSDGSLLQRVSRLQKRCCVSMDLMVPIITLLTPPCLDWHRVRPRSNETGTCHTCC